MSEAPTACVLIIGDEILSGRTQDVNLRYIAERLATLGIRLREARVVPDTTEAIVAAVNAVRRAYTYVFTTGGIGPTHDDITTACVAQAFGRKVVRHPDAERKLVAYFGKDANEARLRMAEVPDGPDVALIETGATTAPGYRIENVFVMAGVPQIAQLMFEAAAPLLARGAPMHSGSVASNVREGDIAADLAVIQHHYPEAAIGSYPALRDGKFHTSIVVRSTDERLIAAALEEIAAMMRRHGAKPERGPSS